MNSSSLDTSLCFDRPPTSFFFRVINITKVLVLVPLIASSIHLGLRQWKKTRSSSFSPSHTDVLTFHLVAMETLSVTGCIFSLRGSISDLLPMAGGILMFITWYGETFFHVLMCVERYLAVVHPVTYRSLRRGRGPNIRNAAAAVGWLLCAGQLGLVQIFLVVVVMNLGFLLLSVLTVSFCSLSVLHVLTRPFPGGRGGNAERVDQSKRKAMQTIVSIWGLMVLRLCWVLLYMVLHFLKWSVSCSVLVCGQWLSLPSSVVLPLLLLHRDKQLWCFHRKQIKTTDQ